MGLYSIKPAFRNLLSGLLPFLKPIHPDILTWGAVVCSIGVGFLFTLAEAHRILFLAIPVLLFIRIALNALDGLLAQATGKARAFGEVLNEATDRLSDIAVLCGIAYSSLSSLAWGLPAIIAVLFSSYIGILGKAVGTNRQYGGILGKADRMLWIGLSCLVAFFIGNPVLFDTNLLGTIRLFDGLLGLFTLLSIITAIQRTKTIYDALASSLSDLR